MSSYERTTIASADPVTSQAMPGFLMDFGYQDSHLPGGFGISTTVQQLISSLVSAGMFVSTFLTGIITDKTGRKGGLWVAIALMFISITVQIAAINVGALYAGRLILGFSNGLFLTCAQLYMQEVCQVKAPTARADL